jgi:uncharacterized protein DUF2188
MVPTPIAGHDHGNRQGEEMPTSAIRVEPTSTGRWVVRHDDDGEPLSEHESATDAERVAQNLAQLEDASSVFLYDRYGRTHRLKHAPGALGTGHEERP